MSPADPRRGSRSNLADLVRTAQDAYRERDYEQVIQLLESIPEQKLSEKLLDLLDLCRERVEEVEELKADIEDALGREKFKELRGHLERLLEIKPGAKRYRDMLKAMNSVRHGQYRVRLHKDGTRSIDVVGSDFSWGGAIVGVSLLAAVCLAGYFAVQWYLNRPTAQLVVRTDDPSLELRVDGERWPWTGTEAQRDVKSGPHEVDVLRDGEIVEHRTVRTEAGKRIALTFEAAAGGALVVHEQQEELAVAVAEAVPESEGAGDSLLPWNWGSGSDRTAVADSLQPVPPGGTVPVVSVLPGQRVSGAGSMTFVRGTVPAAVSATPREGRPNLTPEPSLRIRPLAMSADARSRNCLFSPDGRRFAARRAMPLQHVVRIFDAESLQPLVDVDFGKEPTWVSIDWARGFVVGNPGGVLAGRSYLDPNSQTVTYGGVPLTPASGFTSQFTPDSTRLFISTINNPKVLRLDTGAVEILPVAGGMPSSWNSAPGNLWFAGVTLKEEGNEVRVGVEVRRFPGMDKSWKLAMKRPGFGAGRLSYVAYPSRDGDEAVLVITQSGAALPEGRRDVVFWFHRDGRFVSHELPEFLDTTRSTWFVSDDCRRVANIDRGKSRIVVLESWSGRTLADFATGKETEEIFAATPDLGRLAVHTFGTSPEHVGRVFQVEIFAVDRQ